MTLEEQRKYILEQRKKGVSDSQIASAIKSSSTGQKTQRGFAGEIIPTLASIAGGAGGAFLGGPVGAVAGAAGGAAIGETIQQNIEKSYGQREDINSGQIAGAGIIGGVTQGVGGIALKGASKVAGVLKPKIVQTIKFFSGYSDDVINRALQRTPGAVAAAKRGEPALNEIVRETSSSLQTLAKQNIEETRKAVNSFNKLSEGALGSPGLRRTVLKEGRKFVDNISNTLRSNYRVGVGKEGELYFNRPNLPSNIVSGSEQKAVQEAFNLVKSIQKNTSVKQIDAVLERMITLKTKTPVGTPTGPETKKIIGDMMEEVLSFTENLYPKYYSFLQENLPKRIMFNQSKEIFGSGANMSPSEVSKVAKRLLRLYDTGNLAQREGAEAVAQATGKDVLGAISGNIVKRDVPEMVRGIAPAPRAALLQAAQALPRQALKNYIATGKISGEITNNKVIKGILKTTGMTLDALMRDLVNLSTNKTSN